MGAMSGVAGTAFKVLVVISMVATAMALPSSICKRSAKRDFTCPMNTSMSMKQDNQMRHMYPGLFLPPQAADALFEKSFKIKSFRVIKTLPTRSCRNSGCYGRAKRDVSDCCETETNLLQLLTIEKDGLAYSVVHLPDGNQYLTENACTSEDTTCGSGKCRSLLGLHWVLVTDPNVAYYPPVRFVMVEFKMGCSCEP